MLRKERLLCGGGLRSWSEFEKKRKKSVRVGSGEELYPSVAVSTISPSSAPISILYCPHFHISTIFYHLPISPFPHFPISPFPMSPFLPLFYHLPISILYCPIYFCAKNKSQPNPTNLTKSSNPNRIPTSMRATNKLAAIPTASQSQWEPQTNEPQTTGPQTNEPQTNESHKQMSRNPKRIPNEPQTTINPKQIQQSQPKGLVLTTNKQQPIPTKSSNPNQRGWS